MALVVIMYKLYINQIILFNHHVVEVAIHGVVITYQGLAAALRAGHQTLVVYTIAINITLVHALLGHNVVVLLKFLNGS